MDSTLKSSSSNSSREELLRSTKELCNVFANHGTIEEIISCFSSKGRSNNNKNGDDGDGNDNDNTSSPIRIFEHGLPKLAPFIGRSFYGIQGITDYFTIISDTLEYEDMYIFMTIVLI